MPWITGDACYVTHLSMKNSPPCWQFWLGTDDLGRSLCLRLWQGGRVSLGIALMAAFIDLAIGLVWGTFSALQGGKIDKIMMRAVDVFQGLPSLLIVILLTMLLGPGIHTMVLSISLTGWLNMARMVRANANYYKSSPFVQTAVGMGASNWYIMIHHLLPNMWGTILAGMTFTIPTVIVTEAFLSYLGMGIQPPLASWGTMASDGLTSLYFYPWRLVIPAGCISLTIFCFYTIGDLIHDVIDPREPHASS